MFKCLEHFRRVREKQILNCFIYGFFTIRRMKLAWISAQAACWAGLRRNK